MPTVGGIVVSTGAAADGRRTLLDIIDDLARPIDVSDSTIRALAGDAFRAAVRTMNRKGSWPWEIRDEPLTQTVNSPYTTVTGSIKKPLAMYYLDGNSRPYERIGYIEYENLIEKYDLAFSSRPSAYSIPNVFETGQIRWYGIPVAAESCMFTYYRATPPPRAESETVEIPDLGIEAYMAIAWYEFAKRVPAAQARISLAVAKADSDQAFREISAHINSPGDRVQYG